MRGQRRSRGRAAHVLLHVAHAGRRLDVEPAGVEAHALADQRHLRMAALPQVRSISRGARALARPTAWIIGKFCFEQIVAHDHLDLGAVRLGQSCAPPRQARPAPCRTTAWLMRSRASEIASIIAVARAPCRRPAATRSWRPPCPCSSDSVRSARCPSPIATAASVGDTGVVSDASRQVPAGSRVASDTEVPEIGLGRQHQHCTGGLAVAARQHGEIARLAA